MPHHAEMRERERENGFHFHHFICSMHVGACVWLSDTHWVLHCVLRHSFRLCVCQHLVFTFRMNEWYNQILLCNLTELVNNDEKAKEKKERRDVARNASCQLLQIWKYCLCLVCVYTRAWNIKFDGVFFYYRLTRQKHRIGLCHKFSFALGPWVVVFVVTVIVICWIVFV